MAIHSGNVTASAASTGSFGSLFVDQNAVISGKLTAQEFHTEVTSASIVFQSGSTKFGDTVDDVHQFTGSLNVTGSEVNITTQSPIINLHDTNVSNLKHRILGGGNAGLEFSADINNVGTGYIRFDVANSEALRIKEGGNVGIGDTSPSAKLVVVGTGDNARFGSTSDGVVLGHASGVGYIQGTDTGGSAYNALGFKTSANYAMYIDTSDRVGIGTTTTPEALTIGTISGAKNIAI